MPFTRSNHTRKHYDGTKPTGRHINQILPDVLQEIGRVYHDRPDLILASWPEVIGPKFAPLTQAASFIEGVLTVKVANSTLYSLLSRNDKPRLIQNLRTKFPGTTIKTIVFRLG